MGLSKGSFWGKGVVIGAILWASNVKIDKFLEFLPLKYPHEGPCVVARAWILFETPHVIWKQIQCWDMPRALSPEPLALKSKPEAPSLEPQARSPKSEVRSPKPEA